MNKIIDILTVAVGAAVIILTALHFAMGIGILGLQQLLIALFAAILACKYFRQKKEYDMTFWILIIVGTFNLVAGITIIQPFF